MSESTSSSQTGFLQTIGIPWPDLNDGLSYFDVVRPSDSGLTLIEFYSSKYKNSAPLEGWLQRIQNQQITIDGQVVTAPNAILRVGSEVVYRRNPWKEPDAPYIVDVLYDDDDMIALNKPSGLQVLSGGLFQQRTVLTQLQWLASKQMSSVALGVHPVPVHRLGRGTSGILLCAKTKLAKTSLASYFADGAAQIGGCRNTTKDHGTKRKILKIYRALVNGIVHPDEVVIKQPIGRIQYPRVATGLYVAAPSGKPAMSKVNVLERDEEARNTLVQVPHSANVYLSKPVTYFYTHEPPSIYPSNDELIVYRNLHPVEIQSGRPHQIRIHLSFIGHPLVGDPLYVAGGQPKYFDSELLEENIAEDGGYQRPMKPVPGDCGYFLHAHRLVLSHPKTNKVIEIIAPLPPVLRTREESLHALIA